VPEYQELLNTCWTHAC